MEPTMVDLWNGNGGGNMSHFTGYVRLRAPFTGIVAPFGGSSVPGSVVGMGMLTSTS